MEWNSLLMLLEAAEYLERREREAEHGYASALPFERACARRRTAGRKAPSSRSSHNELEKHRRAKLRLYLEELKQLVPLGAESTRHTTLSLLKRAKMHIKRWTLKASNSPPPKWTAAEVRVTRKTVCRAAQVTVATAGCTDGTPGFCSLRLNCLSQDLLVDSTSITNSRIAHSSESAPLKEASVQGS